jgi:hypothetical protein
MTIAPLVLPTWDMVTPMQDPPHRNRPLARFVRPIEKAPREGAAHIFEVVSNWPGTAWWVSASTDQGARLSRGMKTTSPTTARQWMEAVRAGRVQIGDV